MNKANLIFGAAVLALFAQGCGVRRALSGSGAPGSLTFPPDSDQVHPGLAALCGPVLGDYGERNTLVEGWYEHFGQGQFGRLEKESDRFRALGSVFGNGDSKLIWLYTAMSSDRIPVESWNQKYFEDYALPRADRWIAEYPDSVTARLLRAQILVDYAWYLRSDLTADQVSDDSFLLFARRLHEAWAILDSLSANPLALDDPEYYCLRLHAGYGLGRSSTELTRWYQMGHAKLPWCWEMAEWYTNGIAAKWDGGDLLPVFFKTFVKEQPIAALYVLADDNDICWGGVGRGTPWLQYEPDGPDALWDEMQTPVKEALKKYGNSEINYGRIAKVAANTTHFRDAAYFFKYLPDADPSPFGKDYEVCVWRYGVFYRQVRKHCLDSVASDR